MVQETVLSEIHQSEKEIPHTHDEKEGAYALNKYHYWDTKFSSAMTLVDVRVTLIKMDSPNLDKGKKRGKYIIEI